MISLLITGGMLRSLPIKCRSLRGSITTSPVFRARGKTDQASKLEADLAKTWMGDRQQLELSKL